MWTWGVHRKSVVERVTVTGNIFYDPAGAFVRLADTRIKDGSTYIFDDNEYHKESRLLITEAFRIGPDYIPDFVTWTELYPVDTHSRETRTPTKFPVAPADEINKIARFVVSKPMTEIEELGRRLVHD